jgi:hypothetical protein
MKSVPSPVRNTSSNSDRADWGKAIGELLLDEYLAVHIENLAGGPLHSGRRAVTPNPTTPWGAVFASSVLPWRGAGRYWPDEDPRPHRERFLSVLAEHGRIIESVAGDGLPVVWGGDFNQELEGPYRAGSAEGRDAMLEACDGLGLTPVSTGAGSGDEGSRSIDHIAVPRSWDCGSLSESLPYWDARPLSDHPSYRVSLSSSRQS